MTERTTKLDVESVREKARVVADRAYVKHVCSGGDHDHQVTFGADAASDVWEQHVNETLNGPQFVVLQCGWQHQLFWPEDMVPWPTTCDALISEDGAVCVQPFRTNEGRFVENKTCSQKVVINMGENNGIPNVPHHGGRPAEMLWQLADFLDKLDDAGSMLVVEHPGHIHNGKTLHQILNPDADRSGPRPLQADVRWLADQLAALDSSRSTDV